MLFFQRLTWIPDFLSTDKHLCLISNFLHFFIMLLSLISITCLIMIQSWSVLPTDDKTWAVDRFSQFPVNALWPIWFQCQRHCLRYYLDLLIKCRCRFEIKVYLANSLLELSLFQFESLAIVIKDISVSSQPSFCSQNFQLLNKACVLINERFHFYLN